ncbi:MAG TPA: hypothetical protein VMK12_16170, partial [Anaeromyxobacteraceae bacterium]|nr:hypothetical protein [Anaeromyxobacteraceae bacterium]
MTRTKGWMTVLALFLAAARAANAQDFSALVRGGTPQEVQEAISNGADVELTDFPFWKVKPSSSMTARLYQMGSEGLTPLMVAAANNPDPDVVTV